MPDTTDPDYKAAAAEFIEEAERIAALGLPQLPDDPVQAAAMRAAGYDVLAVCTQVQGDRAVVCMMSENDEPFLRVPAGELAAALVAGPGDLAGREFIATLRETMEDGQVLSAFRPLPGTVG